MKAVILAGGAGTRISEETISRPKPMVEIGGRPILWHIMNIYSHYGVTDFVVCCGFKGYMIKEYFANYNAHLSDISVDLATGNIKYFNCKAEPWKVELIDTGVSTMTGGRLKRIKEHVGEDTFMLTYGDGVADVNITKALEFHKHHSKVATVTAVQPSGRFGSLSIGSDDEVADFVEKPVGDGGWINGGFFIFNSKIFDYIEDDSTVLEKDPLETLAKEKQLAAYKHNGFWRPMDTMRDKEELERIWHSGHAPWKVWT